MKLKVEKEFCDIEKGGKLRKVGEIIEVKEARGDELLAHPLNLVSLVERKVEEPAVEAEPVEEPVKEDKPATKGKKSK